MFYQIMSSCHQNRFLVTGKLTQSEQILFNSCAFHWLYSMEGAELILRCVALGLQLPPLARLQALN